jgi:hypothetical protein
MSENEEDKYNTTFYRIPTKEEIKTFFKNWGIYERNSD